jgi:hypothetical protein
MTCQNTYYTGQNNNELDSLSEGERRGNTTYMSCNYFNPATINQISFQSSYSRGSIDTNTTLINFGQIRQIDSNQSLNDRFENSSSTNSETLIQEVDAVFSLSTIL